MILRARIVLAEPGTRIESGAVAIGDGRIKAIGRWDAVARTQAGPVIDLGEVILCPGLINAHCHLDFAHMAGQLVPGASFPEWIQSLLELRSSWTHDDVACSWLDGARMLLERGVTTVADHETYPLLLDRLLPLTPLRVFSFIELVDLRQGSHLESKVLDATNRIQGLERYPGWRGLSPHAPYTTTDRLLRLIVSACRMRQWRISIHAAESEPEYAMFMCQRGPMYNWLQRQREMKDCGRISPVRHLAAAGLLGEDCLVVHGNYVGFSDASLLARNRASVVHCPRSHEYFRHRMFRAEMMLSRGINLCLGTDSMASVLSNRGQQPRLDLFAEMRLFSSKHPGISPETIFAMATSHGARALGLGHALGRLASGYWADLVAIPYSGQAKTTVEALIHHQGPVTASMIHGHWVFNQHSKPECRSQT